MKQLKEGKSEEEQQRLTDAACALAHCAAGVPDSDPLKATLVAMEQRGQQNTTELVQLQAMGLFTYNGDYSSAWGWDSTHDWGTRNQAGTRALGGLQWLGGNLQTVGGVATGMTCETGLGCAAVGYLFASGYDNANAGYTTMVSGVPTSTWGGKILQGFGISSQASEFLYGATQVGGMGAEAYVADKVVDAQIALSQMARASYQPFVTNGIPATVDVLSTPQAQLLIKEIMAGSPSTTMNEAIQYASGYIESGATMPVAGQGASGVAGAKSGG